MTRWKRAQASAASVLVPGAPESSSAYWSDLRAAAPLHLRLGFAVTTLSVHVGASLKFGCTPDRLEDAQKAQLVDSMMRMPLGGTLLEVGKIVGCFGRYDEEVEP